MDQTKQKYCVYCKIYGHSVNNCRHPRIRCYICCKRGHASNVHDVSFKESLDIAIGLTCNICFDERIGIVLSCCGKGTCLTCNHEQLVRDITNCPFCRAERTMRIRFRP